MHEHASKMELGDKEIVASYMHSSKRDMLSARNTSLYVYGTYHMRMVISRVHNIMNSWSYRTRMVYKIVPYAYGMYVPYAFGMYHTRMVQNSHIII